jgi:hypothetical protein
MAALTWDASGEHFYETGVDRGVLYLPDVSGVYTGGVAWNGLTTVTEKPTGAAQTPQYADNIKYLTLISVEVFGGTIQAFTYPDEFAQCDGTEAPTDGVTVGQQSRKVFGLSYRTRKGNEVEGTDLGYKLHLVYGAVATPSDKAYATINDSPAAIDFSWDFTCTPIAVTDLKPTSLVVVDSTAVDATALSSLEDELYGSGTGGIAKLPTPDEVIALFPKVGGLMAEPSSSSSENEPTE